MGGQHGLGEPRRLGLARRRRTAQARRGEPRRRAGRGSRLAPLGRASRHELAPRRRVERRGLRAHRRRPPCWAVRRARPVGLEPLRPDGAGLSAMPTAEHARLAEATARAEDDLFNANPWYEWGPYLSERAWGTVREDYSADGEAWRSFPHDHARSRAYRWNEDGMAGISDIRHELCLALALWNGQDPILKERMFGLTGPEGNHGEDVKEYWWY